MKSKFTTKILIILGSVSLVLNVITAIIYFGKIDIPPFKQASQPASSPLVYDPDCAKFGESPVSNFDMTKGKIDPNIKVVRCCPGLVAIHEKEDPGLVEQGMCGFVAGPQAAFCRQCGDGVCDPNYEDVCNCKVDCKNN